MNIKFIFLLLSISGCAICHLSAQQTVNAKEFASLDTVALQDVVKNGPGIATGIVKDGKIIYEKYAGYGDLKDSVALSKQSRFNIASNAKQFTALAILTLVEEKKLSLKDDIRMYLPALYPGLKYQITIENLLNHSSGIRDVYDLWALQGITWWQHTYNNNDAVALISRQKDLNFVPGTQHLYSNTNYILLAEIVKKVTGISFTQYTTGLFKKLNMPNTSFSDNYKNIHGPVAKPYFNFDTWTGYNWICNIEGDGNLFTTLQDQLQWEKIVQSRHSKYLSANLIAMSQQPIAGSSITNYGYGLEFGKYKNIDYSYHEGSTGAWKATTIRFPEAKISIITLTNSGKAIPAMQSRQMADVLLGIKPGKKSYLTQPDSIGNFVTVADIVGTYQTENDFTFRFEVRDTDLFLLRSGRNDIRLVRESANIFHQWNDTAFKQEFKLNKQSEMEVTAYYTSHAPYSLKRTNANWDGYKFDLLNGQFYNAETGIYLTFNYQKDKMYSLKIGNETDTETGLLISPVKLLTDNYNMQIIKNDKGIVNELLINGDRIKNVSFRRVE